MFPEGVDTGACFAALYHHFSLPEAWRCADEAGAIITAGEPKADRLLAAAHPTLEAMEAASDLDELYGRMLLNNRNYGWARMMFQKNVARWRSWKPRTAETARHLEAAQAAIAECDRRMLN